MNAPSSSPKSEIPNPKCVAVIPARFASTRFPGKMLADRTGKPLIQHVWERANLAKRVDRVVVATDDQRIWDAVEGFGGTAWMTRADHPSGTDRLAEVADALQCRVILNVQGDEPLVAPAVIDAVVAPLLQDAALEMATACRPLREPEEFTNPNVVKVVRDRSGRALYFSRAPVPWPRAVPFAVPGEARAHLGLYAYRRDVLRRLAPGRRQILERLGRVH